MAYVANRIMVPALYRALPRFSRTDALIVGATAVTRRRFQIPHFQFSRAATSWEKTGGSSGSSHKSEEQEATEKTEDLYATLGLPRGSDADAIKAAYRRLVKEVHPDVRPNDPEAQERFRQISHAHQTLLHVGLRRMYDLHLRHSAARVRHKEIVNEERVSGLRGIMFFRRGPVLSIMAFFLWVSSVLVAVIGTVELLVFYPSIFWTCYRCLPDSLPGKPGVAEAYTSIACARRSLFE